MSPEESAIQANELKEFRIDWVRKLRQVFHLSEHTWHFDESLVSAIFRFQSGHDLIPSGIIDEKTHERLENTFSVLYEPLIGEHTSSRCLFSTQMPVETRFEMYRSVIENVGGWFCGKPGAVALLGIRGMQIKPKEDHIEFWQTDSARNYLQTGRKYPHFSSQKPDPFDSLMVALWTTREGDAIQLHLKETMGTVNPNRCWPAGTAHLRDGQYLYHVGTHGTRLSDIHGQAISRTLESPDNNPLNAFVCDEFIRYDALRASRKIEIWRDSASENDLNIGENAESFSRQQIFERSPAYTDQNQIAINIHTCPPDVPASMGCQNIPLPHYIDWIRQIKDVSARYGEPHILYTLIDSSKLEMP